MLAWLWEKQNSVINGWAIHQILMKAWTADVSSMKDTEFYVYSAPTAVTYVRQQMYLVQ